MGIDGIGKPGPPVAPTSGSVTPTPAVEHPPFAVSTGEARAVSAPDPQGALEQLRAGTISLDRYLDIKVHDATATMPGLAPAQADRVRAALRERLSTDPTLIDLVRKATGAVEIPKPRSEE